MQGEQAYAPARPYFAGREIREGRWQEVAREAETAALREKRAGQAEGPSDRERAERIRAALEAEFGGPDRRVELVDIFRDDSTAVFWLETEEGPEPPGDEFFMAEFDVAADGAVTIAEGEPVRVRRRTVFEPVQAANVRTYAPALLGASRSGRWSRPPAVGEAADALKVRALEILNGLSYADRRAVTSYVYDEFVRAHRR